MQKKLEPDRLAPNNPSADKPARREVEDQGLGLEKTGILLTANNFRHLLTEAKSRKAIYSHICDLKPESSMHSKRAKTQGSRNKGQSQRGQVGEYRG